MKKTITILLSIFFLLACAENPNKEMNKNTTESTQTTDQKKSADSTSNVGNIADALSKIPIPTPGNIVGPGSSTSKP